MPGRPHESQRGRGRQSLKHLRVPSLKTHGQMGTHSREGSVCLSSRGKDGAGLPLQSNVSIPGTNQGALQSRPAPGQPLELRIEWYWGPG